MNNEYDYPTQDEHFNGLEEEIHSDEANTFVHCDNCGELCHPDNLIDGVCEDCEDDRQEDYYEEDDVWADADTLSSAGWGTDEDYGYYGGDEY